MTSIEKRIDQLEKRIEKIEKLVEGLKGDSSVQSLGESLSIIDKKLRQFKQAAPPLFEYYERTCNNCRKKHTCPNKESGVLCNKAILRSPCLTCDQFTSELKIGCLMRKNCQLWNGYVEANKSLGLWSDEP